MSIILIMYVWVFFSLSLASSVVRLDRGFKYSFLINANIFSNVMDSIHRHPIPSLILGGGVNGLISYREVDGWER